MFKERARTYILGRQRSSYEWTARKTNHDPSGIGPFDTDRRPQKMGHVSDGESMAICIIDGKRYFKPDPKHKG